MTKRTSFILLLCICMTTKLWSQTTVMTFNIRYDNQGDGENKWDNRKSELVKLLNNYSPEIFGIQEGLEHQVSYIDSTLTGFNYVGVGRDDGKKKGEYTAIFYKSELIELNTTMTYWLSETPDTVSVGWDASMERIVTYAELVHKKNGDTLHVFNSHLDHIGKIAREKSVELILNIISEKELDQSKIIVMGDFNSTPEERPIEIMETELQDAFKISLSDPYGPFGTFNQFDLLKPLDTRIDYIFTKNIKVLHYACIADKRRNNAYISDHLPVLIQIE